MQQIIIKSYKIRLFPTQEQEQLIWQHIGASRWTWNYMLALQKQRYQSGEKYLNAFGMMKLLSPLKKNEEYAWLSNVSNGTLQTICRDLDKAYNKFFNKTSNLPKFKNRKRSKPSFPVRADRFYFVNNAAHIQMIGKVIYRTNYDLPQGRKHKFFNPRISYVGDKWLLTFGIECENQAPLLTEQFMGIDLGIRDLFGSPSALNRT